MSFNKIMDNYLIKYFLINLFKIKQWDSNILVINFVKIHFSTNYYYYYYFGINKVGLNFDIF